MEVGTGDCLGLSNVVRLQHLRWRRHLRCALYVRFERRIVGGDVLVLSGRDVVVLLLVVDVNVYAVVVVLLVDLR